MWFEISGDGLILKNILNYGDNLVLIHEVKKYIVLNHGKFFYKCMFLILSQDDIYIKPNIVIKSSTATPYFSYIFMISIYKESVNVNVRNFF